MEVLVYNELDTSHVKKPLDKVIALIKSDDFYSADVKKLTGTPYYRAKLDYTNRLLLKFVSYQDKKYALLLEIIHHHNYDKSRFLNGAKINDEKIESASINILDEVIEPIFYLNKQNPRFHILDKIISFDDTQEDIFNISPPLIIIGSAGSGKTMLTLEKMKTFPGEILYVTGSPYLVQNAHQLYYGNHYSNEYQEIEFLSYNELLETIQVPEGKEMTFQIFAKWLQKYNKMRNFQDANKLYEEFKGVITGNSIEKSSLSREDYVKLGIKQSIYSIDERDQVYDIFEKYLTFLEVSNQFDTNILSYHYLSLCREKYDFIVVDEIQDFTPVQLSLILKTLKNPQQFILCGDSNQIVHPNFFSWSKIKSLFYKQTTHCSTEITRIISKNYRNSPSVTAIANKILKAKNTRFGSIDKESHYLVDSQSFSQGEVYCLLENDDIRNEINQKTRKSTRFAVIVLRDDLKSLASQYFQTPLIFSIHEAKGLEYDHVILYNFISSEEKRFRDIAQGVNPEDLQGELHYSRVKDKSDRSLEVYKFFINALYVAITRAIKNVYFIEGCEQHPLLSLLGIKPTYELVPIESQDSTLDDWQKEARRLEMQGKQAQADAIRNTILKSQKVPWEVVTPDVLYQLRSNALDQTKNDKKAKLLFFEYAMHYHQNSFFDDLAKIGFSPAIKKKKDYNLLERKYFTGYSSSNTSLVMRQVSMYGIDFRTVFNQTPLMVACSYGNDVLIKQLVGKGANIDLTDNLGRNAFQIALQKALTNKRYAQEKLLAIYEHLSPGSLHLQVEHKLIKLDATRMEFFIVNAMIIITAQDQSSNQTQRIFNADAFLMPLMYFPNSIVSERRKRRTYISSLLSKHEINRNDIYNKKLFLRIKRGYYVLNPELKIKMENNWNTVSSLSGQAIVNTQVVHYPHLQTTV